MNLFDEEEGDLNYFAKFKPKRNSFLSIQATYMLIVLLLLILIYLIWSYYNWRKISLSKVSDDDSISTVIAKFRLSISKVYDTVQILKFLRKKIHNDPRVLMNAVESNVIHYIFECIRSLSHNDERVVAGLDVLNEIWASNEARAYYFRQAAKDENICVSGVPSYVDEYLQLIKHLQENKAISSESNANANAERESKSHKSNFFGSLFDISSEEPDYSQYEYKLIMGIGLMSTDFPKIQSRVGDKGGIKFVMEAMEARKKDPKISKWGCWALVHLSFNHPPNKCEIIQRGGIPLTIHVLSFFSTSREIIHQALAVLFNLLADDTRTKVNISSVRQMALAGGIIDVIQTIEKTHGKQNQGIQGLCQNILNSLISEWS